MKKILTFIGFAISTVSFAQITITSNLPTNISAGASINVDVKINKGAVGNFAKYQMDVPLGFGVTAVDVKGGNFTFENQRAKIVWVSVPSEPEISLKFKVEATGNAANPGTFAQKFYYLENNEKKEVEAAPVIITIGGSGNAVVATTPVAVETVAAVTPTESKPIENVQATITPTETKPVETVEVKTVTKPIEPITSNAPTETKTAPTSTKVNSIPEAGITFKVQLGAYSTQPNKSKFAGAGNISIENVGGMYKVTTGNFKTKEEAIKYRDELQSKGFSGGFIVKFSNGQRVN